MVTQTKLSHYKDYYAEFAPFVVCPSGGVTDQNSHSALKLIAQTTGLWLTWEPFSWAVSMLHRIASGMAKLAGWIATRALNPGTEYCLVDSEARVCFLFLVSDRGVVQGGFVCSWIRLLASPSELELE